MNDPAGREELRASIANEFVRDSVMHWLDKLATATAVFEAARALCEAEQLAAEASQHRDWDTLDFLKRGEEGRWLDLRNALTRYDEAEAAARTTASIAEQSLPPAKGTESCNSE